MKKKYFKYIAIAIIFVLLNITLVIKEMNKRDSKLGKIEYVTSMNDIDSEMPTIIFFKRSGSEECFDVERVLKLATDRYNKDEKRFNLVHINIEEFKNKEIKDLIDLYNIHIAPTTVFIKADGDIEGIKEGLLTETECNDFLKKINIY